MLQLLQLQNILQVNVITNKPYTTSNNEQNLIKIKSLTVIVLHINYADDVTKGTMIMKIVQSTTRAFDKRETKKMDTFYKLRYAKEEIREG